MVGVKPVNKKLRKRAAGIIAALAGCTEERALCLLDDAHGSVAAAVVMACRNVDFAEASSLLALRGSLRAAINGE
jgi:N-acetylmuramic acid 6-phosphate etherase